MSVESRKRTHRELRAEQKSAMQSGGFFKRLTVREHLDRVRFDPSTVAKNDPGNGFRLVYPTDESGSRYDKFLRKASDIWQVTTGTVRASQVQQQQVVKKKKRLKKKKEVNTELVVALGGGGDEGIPEELPDDEMDEEVAVISSENPQTASALGVSQPPSQPTKLSKQAIAKQVTQRLYSQKPKQPAPPPPPQQHLHIRSSIPKQPMPLAKSTNLLQPAIQQQQQAKTIEQLAMQTSSMLDDNFIQNGGGKHEVDDMIRILTQNSGQLKYKEFCRSLMTSNEEAQQMGSYYRTASASGAQHNSFLLQPIQEGHASTGFSNNRSMGLITSLLTTNVNQQPADAAFSGSQSAVNGSNQQSVNNLQTANNNWSSKNNQAFVQKLKNSVNQGQLTVNAANLLKQHHQLQLANQGYRQQTGVMQGISSPGIVLQQETDMQAQKRALLYQANNCFGNSSSFKQSIFKNDFINSTINNNNGGSGQHIPPQLLSGINHQRIILRCESINNGQPYQGDAVVPQINMSACIIDFKNQGAMQINGDPNVVSNGLLGGASVAYKRQNRRLQSSNNHKTNTKAQTAQQRLQRELFGGMFTGAGVNSMGDNSCRLVSFEDPIILQQLWHSQPHQTSFIKTDANMHPAVTLGLGSTTNSAAAHANGGMTNFINTRKDSKTHYSAFANRTNGEGNILMSNFYLQPNQGRDGGPTLLAPLNGGEPKQKKPTIYIESTSAQNTAVTHNPPVQNYDANLEKLKEYERKLMNKAAQQTISLQRKVSSSLSHSRL
ncbi:hypothetical protein FGO68_gene12866 [Halteria grandinella]|uniref:Uncharacterized protein n=1 Tax=Halteria grandinella TaxID=5974 RepID=A0A8J8NG18_HALGN|nr:hypothetical protein FGO68_gene12866 [Halteria grandinella]